MYETPCVSGQEYDYLLKYIIVGDSGCGKSSLLLRFVDDRFTCDHSFTIGVDFGVRNIRVGSHQVKLQLWDTAGQETFVSITRSYYMSCATAILVYDVTNRASFVNISSWIQQVQQHADQNIPVIIVGNKVDLEHSRCVTTKEGADLAHSIAAHFVETSAKTNLNVHRLFEEATREILHSIANGSITPSEFGGVRVPPTTSVSTLDMGKQARCCT